MVEINFLILSDSAFFSDANKLNIIGAFTYIKSGKVPAAHPQFSVVARVYAPSGEHGISLKIKHQSENDEVANLNDRFKIPEKSEYTDIVMNFVGVVFPKWGRYILAAEVDVNGSKISKNTFLDFNNVAE